MADLSAGWSLYIFCNKSFVAAPWELGRLACGILLIATPVTYFSVTFFHITNFYFLRSFPRARRQRSQGNMYKLKPADLFACLFSQKNL